METDEETAAPGADSAGWRTKQQGHETLVGTKGSWRSKIPIVGPTLHALHRPENRVLEFTGLMAALGYGLVLVASVVVPGPGNTWLSAVGGTFLGVGLSVFCSVVATRQSATESYAKEANLRRKDEIYGPLYAELKKLHDRLLQASRGQAAYPQWIDVPGQKPPAGQAFIPGYERPALTLWPEFKSDHRIDHFTPAARDLLDATLAHARRYNTAALDVRPDAREILALQLKEAIAEVDRSPEYQHWHQEQLKKSPDAFPSQLNTSPRPADSVHQVFAAVAFGHSFETPQRPLHEVWAGAWLEAYPIQQPITLGWLLAGSAQEAARFLYEASAPSNPGATVPQDWSARILEATLADLRSRGTYQAFAKEAREFKAAVGVAAQKLAGALTYIRDRYEGGEPPV